MALARRFTRSTWLSSLTRRLGLLEPLLFLLCVAAFWPARHAGFFYLDDATYMSRLDLRALLSFRLEFWHPVTWLSLLADRALFGPGPEGFHLVNVLLHAANAWLLCALLRQRGCEPWTAAAAAAVFALHPLRVESVAWISERKGLLAAFFGLSCLLLHGQGRRGPAAAAFALAALSKPVVLALPLLLGRVEPVMWLTAAGVGAATLAAQRPNIAAPDALTVLARAGDILDALWTTLRLSVRFTPMRVLAPSLGLCADASYSGARVAVLAVGLGGLSAALFALRRRWSEGWEGWLWLVAFSVPTLGFWRHALTLVADRYTYLPHLGLALAAAGLASRAKAGPWVLAAAAALSLAATRAELRYWTDPLARAALASSQAPASAWARNELGVALLRGDRRDEAETQLREAVRLDPTDARAANNLGVSLIGRDDASARALFSRAGSAENLAALSARDGRPLVLMTGFGPGR
jgi:tetratricopeptide (TPR) repeat protein